MLVSPGQLLFLAVLLVKVTCENNWLKTGDLYKQLNSNCRNEADSKCDHDEEEEVRLVLPRIDGVKVGHTQEIQIIENIKHSMTTLSMRPPVFEIPNFLTDEECEYIIEMAQAKGLQPSPLVKDNNEISNRTSEDTFMEWDINGDGFIDTDEIAYLPGKSDLYFTDKDVEQMFQKLNVDEDGDGKMSMAEFQTTTVRRFKDYFSSLRHVESAMRSRISRQSWVWHDDDELLQYEDLLQDYHQRIANLTKLPKKIIEQSEPLQVVHYKQHGHYHCHHDSEVINTKLPCCTYGAKDCRLCRYLTIMVFLNDVEEGGQCAFPVADNKTFSWDSWSKASKRKCNLARHCDEANLVVKPQKGMALMWYNHLLDSNTRWLSALDPMSYHGGCDVAKGDKWVANIWINIVGDGESDFRAWKMGTNWLAHRERNRDVLGALEIEIPRKPTMKDRYTRETNTPLEAAMHQESEETEESDKSGKVDGDVRTHESTAETKAEKTPIKSDPSPPASSQSDLDSEATVEPLGPDVDLRETPAPLPLNKDKMTEKPRGPEASAIPAAMLERNRILQSVMLLIEELDQVELEILARNLHTKLKLVCVPLIVNPMGKF